MKSRHEIEMEYLNYRIKINQREVLELKHRLDKRIQEGYDLIKLEEITASRGDKK